MVGDRLRIRHPGERAGAVGKREQRREGKVQRRTECKCRMAGCAEHFGDLLGRMQTRQKHTPPRAMQAWQALGASDAL